MIFLWPSRRLKTSSTKQKTPHLHQRSGRPDLSPHQIPQLRQGGRHRPAAARRRLQLSEQRLEPLRGGGVLWQRQDALKGAKGEGDGAGDLWRCGGLVGCCFGGGACEGLIGVRAE